MSDGFLSGMLPILAAWFRLTATFVVVKLLEAVTLMSECWTFFPLGCHHNYCTSQRSVKGAEALANAFYLKLTAFALAALLCVANVFLLSSVISCIRQIDMALVSVSSLSLNRAFLKVSQVTPHMMRSKISSSIRSPKWQHLILILKSLVNDSMFSPCF